MWNHHKLIAYYDYLYFAGCVLVLRHGKGKSQFFVSRKNSSNRGYQILYVSEEKLALEVWLRSIIRQIDSIFVVSKTHRHPVTLVWPASNEKFRQIDDNSAICPSICIFVNHPMWTSFFVCRRLIIISSKCEMPYTVFLKNYVKLSERNIYFIEFFFSVPIVQISQNR